MQTVTDSRPSHELADSEIVAYLFREIRGQGLTRAKQVQQACGRLFPDLPDERRARCLRHLSHVLTG